MPGKNNALRQNCERKCFDLFHTETYLNTSDILLLLIYRTVGVAIPDSFKQAFPGKENRT